MKRPTTWPGDDSEVTQPRASRTSVGLEPAFRPSPVYRELVRCLRAVAPQLLPWLVDRMGVLGYSQTRFSAAELAHLVGELERAIHEHVRPGSATVAIIAMRELLARTR